MLLTFLEFAIDRATFSQTIVFLFSSTTYVQHIIFFFLFAFGFAYKDSKMKNPTH